MTWGLSQSPVTQDQTGYQGNQIHLYSASSVDAVRSDTEVSGETPVSAAAPLACVVGPEAAQ